MNDNIKLKIAKLSSRLTLLKDKTFELLGQTDHRDILDQLKRELSESDSRESLSIAFVGQYSAGKSTIISALTGNKNIKIDANVSTDVVSEYDWNNITLLDTPGILAGQNESHDEATKDALRKSDLILYVLTSQLFDDVVFENFIDLAYNQHLADKIMVVINKMGQEAGEFSELTANYKDSINSIFAERGYSDFNLPIAFIDAADYIEGIEDEDEDYVQLSNFEQFISMLNDFVDERGIIKKQFDTPVRMLQSAVKNLEITQIDPNLAKFYQQFESRLAHNLAEISRDFTITLNNFQSQAIAEVLSASHSIGKVGEEEWKNIATQLDNVLITLINTTSANIEMVINDNYRRLMEEMEQFSQKDTIVKYREAMEHKLSSSKISIEEKTNLERQRNVLNWLTKGGIKIADMAPGVKGMFDGISSASGSTLHDIVLKVGHFFGKKFKPWEAVGTASKIAKGAKFGIPILGVVLDIGMQLYQDRQDKKIQKQIQTERNRYVTAYQSELNRISGEFKDYFESVRDNYNLKRDELNASKDELNKQTQRNLELLKDIESLNQEYVDFIEVLD